MARKRRSTWKPKRQALGRSLSSILADVSRPARRRVTVPTLPRPRDVPTVLSPRPRQRELTTKQRLATMASLAASPSTRAKRRDITKTGLREALCAEYKKAKSARRETMFATGSAGKGRRNPGPRKPDWRREYCR